MRVRERRLHGRLYPEVGEVGVRGKGNDRSRRNHGSRYRNTGQAVACDRRSKLWPFGWHRTHPCRRTAGGTFEGTAWRPRERWNLSGRFVLPVECHPGSTAAATRTEERHHPPGRTFFALVP